MGQQKSLGFIPLNRDLIVSSTSAQRTDQVRLEQHLQLASICGWCKIRQ